MAMIETERMTETFLELVKIDSPSRDEREIAERLEAKLKELGGEVSMDHSGERTGSNAGNLFARFPGMARGTPILLSAHMDTVMPGRGVKPIRESHRIRSDGSTILGADDKSGIAIILEVIQSLKERKIKHPPLEVVFTVCEELGLVGAKEIDPKILSSRDGLVLDSGPANGLFIRGPAADRVEVKVQGLAAHAGVCPEEGISAIRIAAEAISKMKLGRIDSDTTSNIGTIQGGTAINIIPDKVIIQGEARSHDESRLTAQSAHMVQCFKEAAANHDLQRGDRMVQPTIEASITRDYNRMNLGKQALIVKQVLSASEKLGTSIRCQKTGGGCDANVFNVHGAQIANLGTGMRSIHTIEEHLLLDEFYQTAEVVITVLSSMIDEID